MVSEDLFAADEILRREPARHVITSGGVLGDVYVKANTRAGEKIVRRRLAPGRRHTPIRVLIDAADERLIPGRGVVSTLECLAKFKPQIVRTFDGRTRYFLLQLGQEYEGSFSPGRHGIRRGLACSGFWGALK